MEVELGNEVVLLKEVRRFSLGRRDFSRKSLKDGAHFKKRRPLFYYLVSQLLKQQSC